MGGIDVSFVIPCYKSERSISKVVREILETVDLGHSFEIILVNDGSPDNTMGVIRQLCKMYPQLVKGINLSRNFGQSSAIMAGLNNSKGDIIVCLDDDGQSPVDSIETMIGKIEEGYDLVYADYLEKKESAFRLFGSRINELMMTSLLNKPKEITVNSFFACSRMVVDEVINYKGAFPYLPGLVLRATRNITNVKVVHRERAEGRSGYTFKKLLSLWINGFTSFSVKPLRVAVFLGIFFSLIGFVFIAVLLIRKMMGSNVQIGWTSIISVITFFDGLMLIVMGLVGEYVGRIYLCINSTPQFVVKERIGIEEITD